MFHSARLKLTMFYMAAIIVLSLSLSIGIRVLAEHEFERSNTAQRGAYRGIVRRIFDFPAPPNEFDEFQHNQEALVGRRLNEYVIYVNIMALIIGGLASYWFAGRTLKPIEEAHDAQKRFASDASHELRTPLTNMRVENEVFLRQKDFSTREARQQIESNLEEVQRLESLSSSLLALTQYETAQLKLEPVQVKSIITTALESVEKARRAKKIKVVNNAHEATVSGHQESLAQLLNIVLDNAIKYSPTSSVVTIKTVQEGNDYRLAVQDEGPGIDEEDLPHIFDRLYRGDKARSSTVPGYGLGLSLAKHIAAANKAEISATNNIKKGATFYISFNG